jgi:outer membrane protein OmpA-like peptidoglycan-associated protein
MNDRSRKRAVRNRPTLMIVRRDGSMRQAGGTDAQRSNQVVTFPVAVEFARGSSTPCTESLTGMHTVAQWLAKRPFERVTVVGHANIRAAKRVARSLARERVRAVLKLLVLLGARPDQLVPLAATRLHSVQLGSTHGERQRQRVVVIFRHEPLPGRLRRPLRRTAGVKAASRR